MKVHRRLQSSCTTGQYWSVNRCYPCDVKCTSCSAATHCFGCQPGYYYLSFRCYTCKAECLTCTSKSACIECSNGYFRNGSLCASCGSGCSKCTSLSKCTACVSSSYRLEGGSCVLVGSVYNAGYTSSSETNTSSSENGSIVGIIVGVVVGSIALVAFIWTCVIICICCRKKMTHGRIIRHAGSSPTNVPQSNHNNVPTEFSAPNPHLNPFTHVQHQHGIMLQHAPPVQQPILNNPDAARSYPPLPTSGALLEMPPPMYEVNITSYNTQTNQRYPKPYQPKL